MIKKSPGKFEILNKQETGNSNVFLFSIYLMN